MGRNSERFVELARASKEKVLRTDIHQVRDRVENGEKVNLVDIREDNEWNASRIPGAVHLGKGVIERDVEDHFPELDTELVLYCGGGSRSAIAAESLMKMGYTHVVSMDGGIRGWREAGYDIEEG